MSRAQQLIEGLQILLKYDPELEVVAEHDEIFAGHEIETVHDEDEQRLEELGWTWDHEVPAWKKRM